MPSGRNAIGTVAGTALRAACFVFGTLCFSSLSAYANEVVTLADNTQIAGKLTHYFDGVVVMETSGGQKLELPRDKIKSIAFKLPPPRAEFSTPEKTFERWRSAMVKGDVQKAVDCYALLYQGQVGQQMMQSADELKKAQKDLEGVQFELRGSTFKSQGEFKLANLKVRRTKGENVQTDEVNLVLENGEWKMTP
ncbi:MAG TPA: hypothetical protein PKW11_17195 [Pseudomonadota bacterium]|nr:hypothetical protein [Pseudomonadota bacterium]